MGQHFPSKFCVANGLNELCSEIIIRDERGKVWNVELGGCRRKVYTRLGWKSFVAEKDLGEGDKFEFRIVSKGKTPVLSFRSK